ncbi:MAG: hypothetical protein M5R36_08575 [Deltaproteobacteria bacterium]|nr:hypothetical protein [Deltaproteobacteria bacterium]
MNVEVLPGMIAAARSSKPVKIAAFVGGLLAFWLTVWLVRRRRKLSAASVVERAAEVRPNAAWEALESEARERPEGSFYARLEELVWSDVFRPDAVPPGTAATRLAELAAHGANQPAVDAVRRIVDDCQKRRYGGGTVSQGDAIDALRAAREAVRAVRGDA